MKQSRVHVPAHDQTSSVGIRAMLMAHTLLVRSVGVVFEHWAGTHYCHFLQTKLWSCALSAVVWTTEAGGPQRSFRILLRERNQDMDKDSVSHRHISVVVISLRSFSLQLTRKSLSYFVRCNLCFIQMYTINILILFCSSFKPFQDQARLCFALKMLSTDVHGIWQTVGYLEIEQRI